MIEVSQRHFANKQEFRSSQVLEEFAYQVISKQFKHFSKQEKKVLRDEDPEPLHQMRVGTRRLRTALEILDQVVELPKGASGKQLRDVARVLGAVRDLDVQVASLQQEYQPYVSKQEQHQIDQLVSFLQKRRKKAFAKLEKMFRQSPYQELTSAFTIWLESPRYTPAAQFPLSAVLPDLLSPLLSTLLLHPGWLISIDDATGENAFRLHELRKVLKHTRYQTEFFISEYGEDFQDWVNEVKTLQDRLGQFQDIQVLQALLLEGLGKRIQLPQLQEILGNKRDEALSSWEQTRLNYLHNDYRYHLHQMLLQPPVG